MTAPIRIVQLTDTHFLDDGATPEGGSAYDTDEAFAAVLDHLGDDRDLDLVVVTGDIADHGRPTEYRKAAAAFSRFTVPVNVCPGNHDFDLPYTAGMARPGVATSRVIEIGNWAFVFVDSCARWMLDDDSGLPVDPPGETRLHSNGGLGPRESAWIRRTCAAVNADHIFVWMHHPPAPRFTLFDADDYESEWAPLIDDIPRIRGFGCGHTHIPDRYEFMGRPVIVGPSLKNNFSVTDRTWLPPGYRTFAFSDDGTVTSELHLVDDDRWPRHPFGRLMTSLFDREISMAEFGEIVARRAAGA